MCDLVASPDLCALLIQSPEQVLARYDLSVRDRRRLVEVVQQQGMFVNCSLYRTNRISPIYNLMPYTCFVLGDALMDEATEFWKNFDESRLQFDEEVKKFGNFLRRRIELGFQTSPILPDVLEYELASNELRFTSRKDVLAFLERNDVRSGRNMDVRLHPLLRLLLFRHEPRQLLELLNEKRSAPYEIPEGEFWLLLDGKGETLETKLIEPGLGRLLNSINVGTQASLNPEDVGILLEAGLVVRSHLETTDQDANSNR
jgi:hypothetical protein